MQNKYQKDIYLFLSLYRFFAYGLAVVLIQVVPGEVSTLGLETLALLVVMGVYTLLKVIGPLRWWDRDPMTYLVLGGDLLVCVVALLLTGGLTSGFLLYSLLPVMTAALLFDERLALLTAAVTSAFVLLAHTAFHQWGAGFDWIMESNLLLWTVLYIIAAFLVATSVFRTNLNIRQFIQNSAVADERKRIRREMHDGVAQVLGYLARKTESVGRFLDQDDWDRAKSAVTEVREAVDESYRLVRESLDQLSLESGSASLETLLPAHLKQFEDRYQIKTSLSLDEGLNLPDMHALQIFRVIQEALTNVHKHSQATEVSVSLQKAPRGLELLIRDNGQGFSCQEPADGSSSTNGDGGQGGHFGLAVMRERAEAVGGALSVDSAPGSRTEVRMFVPDPNRRLVLWTR